MEDIQENPGILINSENEEIYYIQELNEYNGMRKNDLIYTAIFTAATGMLAAMAIFLGNLSPEGFTHPLIRMGILATFYSAAITTGVGTILSLLDIKNINEQIETIKEQIDLYREKISSSSRGGK